MSWFTKASETSVGKKGIMAVTGTILLLFILVHMLGNTHLWEKPAREGLQAGWVGKGGPGDVQPLDYYGRLLRTFPMVLWAFRLVMLVTALLHVITGVRLWWANRRARPIGYTRMSTVQASLASRTMIYTGAIVMAFLVYHLLHLTLGRIGPFEEGQVYRNVVEGFQLPVISVLYIIGQVLLFFHLTHGTSSLFQTLGFNHPKYKVTVERTGMALALAICGINILFPVSVLLGWVKLG
jgi:succinate dehydrogenase / fumarate reductase, cytochrome b subunit